MLLDLAKRLVLPELEVDQASSDRVEILLREPVVLERDSAPDLELELLVERSRLAILRSSEVDLDLEAEERRRTEVGVAVVAEEEVAVAAAAAEEAAAVAAVARKRLGEEGDGEWAERRLSEGRRGTRSPVSRVDEENQRRRNRDQP